jgi:hypothetical protein
LVKRVPVQPPETNAYQVRVGQIAKASTSIPSVRLVHIGCDRAAYAARATDNEFIRQVGAVQAHEVVIGERADDKISKSADAELVVAAATDPSERHQWWLSLS